MLGGLAPRLVRPRDEALGPLDRGPQAQRPAQAEVVAVLPEGAQGGVRDPPRSGETLARSRLDPDDLLLDPGPCL
jgi:hypothetical protein